MAKRSMEPKRTVGVAQLKSHLSQYLDRVKSGREVTVTEHGRPIARIVPVILSEVDDERMKRLVREGRIIPPCGAVPQAFWTSTPALSDPDGHVLRALLTEREEGR